MPPYQRGATRKVLNINIWLRVGAEKPPLVVWPNVVEDRNGRTCDSAISSICALKDGKTTGMKQDLTDAV